MSLRVVLQGRLEDGLAGQEHDHELGRGLELLPVALGAQLGHVVADLAGVIGQLASRVWSSVASCASRYASSGTFASTTTVRPPGSRTSRSGRMRPLSLSVVDCSSKSQVLEHAGHLDHAPQLHLAPPPAHGRRAQGPHEVGGLGAQLRLAAADGLEQRRDLGAGLDAVLLHLAELLIDLLQHVADRRDQLVERLLLARDLGDGVLLQPRQALVRQLEELLVARLQRRRRPAPGSCRAAAVWACSSSGHLLRDELLLVLELGRQRGPDPREASTASMRVRSRSSRERTSSACTSPSRRVVWWKSAWAALTVAWWVAMDSASSRRNCTSRQDPGGKGAGGEAGQEREQNDDIHRANRRRGRAVPRRADRGRTV